MRSVVSDKEGKEEAYYTVHNDKNEQEVMRKNYNRLWVDGEKTYSNKLDSVNNEIRNLDKLSDKRTKHVQHHRDRPSHASSAMLAKADFWINCYSI